jgi:hypothetical protein
MPRGYTRKQKVFLGKSIGNSETLTISDGFPIGGFIRKLMLHFHLSMTHSSESGAVTDGELLFLKRIRFFSNKQEQFIDSCARALYYFTKFKHHTASSKDAIAAASSAVYDVYLEIPFNKISGNNKNDCVIDTRRYGVGGLTLEMQIGALADMFSTTTGATCDVTVDCYVETENAGENSALPLPGQAGYPIFYPTLYSLPGFNIESQTELNIPHTNGLGLKGLVLMAGTSGSAVPWVGTLSNAVVSTTELRTDKGSIQDISPWKMTVAENKVDYEMETAATGIVYFNFTKHGSLQELIASKDYSQITASLVVGTASTSFIHSLVEGVKTLLA